jgi:hypothetical protein
MTVDDFAQRIEQSKDMMLAAVGKGIKATWSSNFLYDGEAWKTELAEGGVKGIIPVVLTEIEEVNYKNPPGRNLTLCLDHKYRVHGYHYNGANKKLEHMSWATNDISSLQDKLPMKKKDLRESLLARAAELL